MDAADKARRLEQELEDDPEDRDDVLLEAADAWRSAGDPNRAIQLLTEAIGGENTDRARVVLAEVLFGLGREDEARAQLDALRKSWPESADLLDEVAMLLDHRGELEEALTWYELALARLEDDDERATSYISVGRRRVRRKLGLPEDDLDAAVEHLERQMDDFVRKAIAKVARPDQPR
jgi:tetratricopeptide (TPR) repeat protein